MKQRKLNTRNDKVSFLKALATGKASLSEIHSLIVEMWFKCNDEEEWTNEHTKQRLTNEEMKAKRAKAHGSNHLIFITEYTRDEEAAIKGR